MKVLVIDPILFLAPTLVQRLVLDGHEVVYAPIWGPKSDSPFMDVLCRGLGCKVDPEGWMNYVDWADVATISGSEHRGHIARFLRANGVPVCGPGPWGTRLELDRQFGHQALKDAGLKPSKQHVFWNAEEAADFVKSKKQRYIVKLDQTARAVGETFVGMDEDGRDVVSYLRDLQSKLFFTDRVKVYLEEPLSGVEVGVGAWFNGEKFLGPLMVTYETDGGYAYDLRMAADTLIRDRSKLEALLRKAKFRGSLDINGFLTDDGWRPIEWTPRWGAGTTEMMAHAAEDLGALLHAAATGKDAKVLRDEYRNKFVVLVNYRDETEGADVPLDIMLPDGAKKLPMHEGNRSFWARWPALCETGWLSLPVLGSTERRAGVAVGVGEDLEAAFENASEVGSEVKISGCHLEIGRAREEITPQVDAVIEKITGHAPSNEWIARTARDTRHMW
jgi:hypothetical protein